MTDSDGSSSGVVVRTARAAAVRAGRTAVRSAGMVTSSRRPLPEFLIIGAKRGGTTSLHSALSSHPQVLSLFPSGRTPLKRTDTKGVHYFVPGPLRSEQWYRSHFPSERARRRRTAEAGAAVAGEASPYYLFHPWAAARAAALLPEAKVIALLRDPVERTSSHYREQRRNGIETLSFEEALAAEPHRLGDVEQRMLRDPDLVSFAHEQQSYRAQSRYGRSLERWLSCFPREQVLLLLSEDFYGRPQETYDQVVSFLGLDAHELTREHALNSAPKAVLADGVRRELSDSFADDVQHVERLLGRPTGWGLRDA